MNTVLKLVAFALLLTIISGASPKYDKAIGGDWYEMQNEFYTKCCERNGKSSVEMCGEYAARETTEVSISKVAKLEAQLQSDLEKAEPNDRTILGVASDKREYLRRCKGSGMCQFSISQNVRNI